MNKEECFSGKKIEERNRESFYSIFFYVSRTPPHFSTIAQKNENIWHVPYTPEDDTVNEMYQKTWLCLNCS